MNLPSGQRFFYQLLKKKRDRIWPRLDSYYYTLDASTVVPLARLNIHSACPRLDHSLLNCAESNDVGVS